MTGLLHWTGRMSCPDVHPLQDGEPPTDHVHTWRVEDVTCPFCLAGIAESTAKRLLRRGDGFCMSDGTVLSATAGELVSMQLGEYCEDGDGRTWVATEREVEVDHASCISRVNLTLRGTPDMRYLQLQFQVSHK